MGEKYPNLVTLEGAVCMICIQVAIKQNDLA
jgi:hypothetical protein